jgi:hypothetical protein
MAMHAERIRESGILGKSVVLRRLFEFLIDCAAGGRIPKEIDIAVEVLGREAFDVTQDASVRVYVHKLRGRLNEYYEGSGATLATRIVVVKGQYRLAVEPRPQTLEQEPGVPEPGPGRPGATGSAKASGASTRFGHAMWWMAAALCASVLANVLLIAWGRPAASHPQTRNIRDTPVWTQILHDDLPVVVVIGDYYIFGETDPSMEVKRMVREFSINSARDLDQYVQNHPQVADRYMDLNLTYLPTSAAPALRELLPILIAQGKRVQVILMSDLTADMLTRSDIVYVGYLSGLGMLQRIVFSGSGFSIGSNFDELISRHDQRHFISQGGNPWRENATYRDYGYLSTFAGPNGNRFVIVSGTRDAAVASMAEAVSRLVSVDQLVKQSQGKRDFEALYEVYGVGHTNVGMKLLTAQPLDTGAIWRN